MDTICKMQMQTVMFCGMNVSGWSSGVPCATPLFTFYSSCSNCSTRSLKHRCRICVVDYFLPDETNKETDIITQPTDQPASLSVANGVIHWVVSPRSMATSSLSSPLLAVVIHSSRLSLPSTSPPSAASHSSTSISFHTPVIMSLPRLPIRLLNGTHWPWLICCIWLNEGSFTYLITLAAGINDRWPLGGNTEAVGLKKKREKEKKNPDWISSEYTTACCFVLGNFSIHCFKKTRKDHFLSSRSRYLEV